MALPSTTDPSRRRYATALLVGLIGGLFSAIVKFGWEVPFPPRTPERNATKPPQQLLQQLGLSEDFTHTLVHFNGNGLPIMSFIVHFSFAIVFAVLYCVVAERSPRSLCGREQHSASSSTSFSTFCSCLRSARCPRRGISRGRST